MNNVNEIVPDQRKGGHSDNTASVECKSEAEAQAFFQVVKKRLRDVNHWHEYAGVLTADFSLTDSDGHRVKRLAEKGDYFRIDIPGPGSKEGDGYDWVRIEAIAEEQHPNGREGLAIRVRPAPHPAKEDKTPAHFFREDATSSFVVEREGRQISAAVHGRNEVPNTKAPGLRDKARNAVIAAGAIAGLSDPQWKALANGLLQREGGGDACGK